MDSKPKLTASIIYCRTDDPVVRELYDRLAAYRLPPTLPGADGGSAKLGPFRLRHENTPGTEPECSNRLIVCCSHAAARSKWVAQQTEAFLQRSDRKRVFAVIVDGEPHDALPDALLDEAAVTADLRPRADGRHVGFLKLVAALADVKPGTLADAHHQHERRTTQRRTSVAAGLLAVALVVAATSVSSARRATSRARTATATAIDAGTALIAQAAQAHRTYGLPTSAVALLADRANQDFARLFDRRPREPHLMTQQMHMQLSLSDLYGSIGQTDAQARHADGAVAVLRGGLRPAAVEPHDYVRALATQADARFAQGDVHGAERAFRDAIAAGRSAVSGRLRGVKVHLQLAYAQQSLARIYIGENRAAEAIPLFEAAQRQLDEAVRRTQDNPRVVVEAVRGLNWVGSAKSLSGQPETAVETFRTAVSRAEDARQTWPKDLPLLEVWGQAHMKLGQSLSDVNRHDEAQNHVARSIEAARTLTSARPRATPLQRALALRLVLQANVDLHRDAVDAATRALVEATTIYHRLAASNPDDIAARIDHAQALALEASAHERRGQASDVLAARKKAADLWANLVDPQQERRWERLEALAVAYEQWGDAAAQAQNLDQMLSAYGQAEPLRRRMRGYRDDEPGKTAHAKALHALGLTLKFARQPEKAVEALDESAQLRLQIGSPPARFAAAESLRQLALIQVGTDSGAGKASLVKARDVLRSLVSSHPGRPAYGASLEKTKQMLALIGIQDVDD